MESGAETVAEPRDAEYAAPSEAVPTEEGNAAKPVAEEQAGEEEEPASNEPGPSPEPGIDFMVKHPLQRSWTMWYDNPGGRSAWTIDRFKAISCVATVEDFWRMYNNIMPPSGLNNGSNYHLFKEDIRPMWEDQHNVRGGKWIVVFPKGRKDSLDEYWLYLLLAMIGESFHDIDEVCGAVVSVRKQNSKIALWTRNAAREAQEAVMKIGIMLRNVLQLEEKWKIGYQAHDAASKDSTPQILYEI